MTTIVIKQNTLYGDRRRTVTGQYIQTFDGPKIFRSERNQFAYGISGIIPEGKDLKRLENEFYSFLKVIYVAKLFKNSRPFPKKMVTFADIVPSTSGFAFLTRDFNLTLESESDDGERRGIVSLPQESCAIGSGSFIMMGYLMRGVGSMEDAYKVTSFKDAGTGTDFDTIPASTLSPFAIEEDIH